jgi:hypothetical protein
MVTYDDDEHKTLEIPIWGTLTEVSEALGVSRNAVKSAARRALKRQEPWVKKDGNIILINIQHELYRSYARRWQEQHTNNIALEDIADEDNPFQNKASSEDGFATPYRCYPSLTLEGYLHWPEFCQWLASQGLYISCNLLTGENTPFLQWYWGNRQGEGNYTSVKDAVIAALSTKLKALADAELDNPWFSDFASPDFQPPYPQNNGQHSPPFWHGFFGKSKSTLR